MPTYNLSPSTLQQEGPIIRVRVGVTPAREQVLRDYGLSIPEPVPVRAIIDTGAWKSVVRADVISRLSLSPIIPITVPTASSPGIESFLYEVTLLFPEDVALEIAVIGLALPSQANECLIGRDVLRKGTLVYSGTTGSYSFDLL